MRGESLSAERDLHICGSALVHRGRRLATGVQVATSVEEGVKQLVRAEKIQKSSRIILCIMFLVVAVVLMLLILVAKNILL